MANLPEELINEILLWLPVKSLLRFRCVCKSFCARIESQSFINSHFKKSSENRIHSKLIDLGVHWMDNKGLPIHALDFNEDFQQEVVLDKLFPSGPYPLFFSYCNGLVLLYIFPCEFHVWNPSTRKYRILPDFPVSDTRKLKFGLGYDSTTDDFKVVVFISTGCIDVKFLDFSQVWVFELRSNFWRRIQDCPYIGYNSSMTLGPYVGYNSSMTLSGDGVCFVDGALHFICYGKPYIIVAFDVAKKTFSIVHELDGTKGIPICLNVLGGCLSINLFITSLGGCVDIYARKKDGVSFTWTRLYSVTREISGGRVFNPFVEGKVAYSNKGDKVFLSSNGKLCSYDFGEKTL